VFSLVGLLTTPFQVENMDWFIIVVKNWPNVSLDSYKQYLDLKQYLKMEQFLVEENYDFVWWVT
jgi:hypothetical protein